MYWIFILYLYPNICNVFRIILGPNTSWHKITCIYASLAVSKVEVAKLPFKNVSCDLASAESCPSLSGRVLAGLSPKHARNHLHNSVEFQVPMADKVPECSSVSLAIAHRASSSMLRAIVLPKLILEKPATICACLQALPPCYAGLRLWSSYMPMFLVQKASIWFWLWETTSCVCTVKLLSSIEFSSDSASSCLVWGCGYLTKCLP